MRYIVWSIQNLGAVPMPSMQELSYKIAPYLERAGGEVADTLPSPRTLNVHFPYQFTPYHKDARYVYVARNPRDTCVSYYHMTRESLGGSSYMDATFDEYFELFVTGNVPYGDYFDHVLAWYERRYDSNVLFLTFEDMLTDPASAVLRVARFISDQKHDYEKLLMENDCSALRRVIENTTFDNMKASEKRERTLRTSITSTHIHFGGSSARNVMPTGLVCGLVCFLSNHDCYSVIRFGCRTCRS